MKPNTLRTLLIFISVILLLSLAFSYESSITGNAVVAADMATHPVVSIFAMCLIIVVMITGYSIFRRD